MGKLHLKETPEERADRKWRKAARRAERTSCPHSHHHEPARRRRRTDADAGADGRHGEGAGDPPVVDGWEDDGGGVPPDKSRKIDPEQVRAEAEEERLFREKLFDAMAEDDYERDCRLDGLESQLNEYVHVPHRWKGGSAGVPDSHLSSSVNLNEMADEEYVEWIREGMWRRTHRDEIEKQERKKAERKARKEQERRARAETARLEQQRKAEQKIEYEFRERRRRREAWDYYETRWRACTKTEPPDKPLQFRDVPWPVFTVPSATESLTLDRISAFVLYGLDGDGEATNLTKARRERIREALLRWHPDKFEGKIGSKLDQRERDMVLEGVGIVARCLNELMAK